jgi:ABC-type dipeptide/oligopeptide/nickel transport system permease subunit
MSNAQLQQAISYLESGQRAKAHALLLHILKQDSRNDAAWFVMASCLDVAEQKRFCLEKALMYGTGNWRIIKNYMVPRIIPVMVPQLVATIPGFIFLEATLAILGVYDLYLPTWGKIIYDALTKGAFQGYYYWILEPLALLLLTGMAFALVGFALDRVFNPRLRTL